MMKIGLWLVCLAIIGVLAGCSVPMEYFPGTKMEKAAFSKANRYIFPNDVRKNFTSYKTIEVAWPGIIKSVNFQKTKGSLRAMIRAEHHYYDWIEDTTGGPPNIYLSPRGEGSFETDIKVTTQADSAEIAQLIGYLIIVYGTPYEIKADVIMLKESSSRIIEPKFFVTDVMDYGRPGEPMKLLKVP
jgi:hypothetical protein